MADFVLTLQEVGRVVQYVAPGFFARLAYEARFPRAERSSLNTIIWSVAASLPLVAVSNQLASWLGIRVDATSWQYVSVLLAPAVLVGYAVAALRSIPWTRKILGRFGLRHQPDGSLYAMTMLGLPRDAVVVLELHDGRMVSGTPRAGRPLLRTTSTRWYSRIRNGGRRRSGRPMAPARPCSSRCVRSDR